MDFVTGHIGWIEVICGPMFSGKSEELIRRLRRARIARKRVQVFKPALDDRYSMEEIVSHSDARLSSEVVKDATEILSRLDWRTQVVGIDEANFMGPALVEVANQMADSGKQVIIAGLDTDYMGRPFAPMPELLALAESITKTLAICMRCGNPGKHTQRLVESDDLIVVGAAGMYEARCRRCFEPGVPKQEYLEFARPRLRGDGRQKTEDGSRETEDGSRETEDGSRETEDGSRETEDGSRETEDGSRETEDGRQKTEDRRRKTEDGSWKPDAAGETGG